MSDRGPLRLAVLATHPVQYQAPVWRALAGRPDLDLLVYFGTDQTARRHYDSGFGTDVEWNVPLMSGYAHTTLTTASSSRRIGPLWPRAAGLGRLLDARPPDAALLGAYASVFWLEALAALKRRRVPLVLRHEASDEALARGPIKASLRDLLLRRLYSRIAAFAVIGTAAARHLRRLGVPSARCVHSPYAVDSALMESQASHWLPQRPGLRAALGAAPEDCIILFSGKIIPKKDPLLIPAALSRLPAGMVRRIHLAAIGDGPLRPALESSTRAMLGARFHAPGFVDQRNLGRWYAAADCLVLPSRRGAGETWGLVVNEAFHFGLPAVASDGAGCHYDLLQDRQTGRTFPAGDSAALAAALEDIVSELPGHREAYAAATRRRIAGHTTEKAAEGIAAAVALAVGCGTGALP